MNDLLLKSYEYLTVLLPSLITFVILRVIYKQRATTPRNVNLLKLTVFSLYIFAVFYFTGAGTVYDLIRNGVQLNAEEINLLPFSRAYNHIEHFLNIMLFVPFGFLMPITWPGISKFKYTLFSGFSFSLLIELSQLLNFRQTDIDDLLLNTLGTLVGYSFFRLLFRKTNKTASRLKQDRYEPAIYILSASLGHFLFFNAFGMAKFLYDF
jgi:Glycopeptide antibiotics resistance protein